MTQRPERVVDYIQHILDAIERIERYTEDMDQPSFLSSDITQDAVIRNLEIIGEAGNNIKSADPEFESRYPQAKLTYAYEMRNVLSHGYFLVDISIVWSTLENDLPELQTSLQNALQLMNNK